MKSNNKTPIKIAIVLPTLAYGGAEKLVLEELRVLSKDNRFAFELILLFEPGPLFEEFNNLDIKIKVFNSSHKPLEIIFTYFMLYRYVRREKFDIVHVHLLCKPIILILKFLGSKFLLTVHNTERAFSFLEKITFVLSDKVIACGVGTYQFLKRFVADSKLFLLSNGIRRKKIKAKVEELKSRYNIQNNFPTILSIGSLTYQKGFEYLIKSIALLKVDYPKIKLLIAGDGKLRDSLQGLIGKLGLDEHITLLGIVKNVFELFELSDIYVNSSLWEGLPLTLLEAMSMKIPIIATNVGGNSEVIIDSQTGLLIKPESEYEIAEAIKKLVNNSEFAERLADNGYKLFKEKYTIEKHCEKLANLYLSMLG